MVEFIFTKVSVSSHSLVLKLMRVKSTRTSRLMFPAAVFEGTDLSASTLHTANKTAETTVKRSSKRFPLAKPVSCLRPDVSADRCEKDLSLSGSLVQI